MKSINIAINGFGRIGRLALRANHQNPRIKIVSINDPGSIEEMAYLLKYDSLYGIFAGEIVVDGDCLIVNGEKIKVTHEYEPEKIDYKSNNIDIVLECTGIFTSKDGASRHIQAGARRVLISAPGKDVDATFCMGINHETFDANHHVIVSNASCTTNCLAPIAKVLDEKFGIVKGTMTTVHSYTNDQKLTDATHKKDFRRARAANLSIIPTDTGAAKAISLVLPNLKGKLDGISLRVPTPTVSLVDLVCELATDTTKEEINEAFIRSSENELKGILGVTYEPLTSIDFKKDPRSSIVDAQFTGVMQNNLVKILSWYDNEWGYAERLVDLAEYIGINS